MTCPYSKGQRPSIGYSGLLAVARRAVDMRECASRELAARPGEPFRVLALEWVLIRELLCAHSLLEPQAFRGLLEQ